MAKVSDGESDGQFKRSLHMQKRMMSEQTFDKIKDVGDGVAVFVTIGTIASFLPAIAALFTIFWTGIRIWETDTVKKMTGRW